MKSNMKKLGVCFIILCVLMGSLSSLAAAEWPMFQNNPRHTGYVNQDSSFSTQTWTVKVDGAVSTTPVLCGDQIYLGTDKGTLYALDAQDGNETWKYETEGAITSSPTVSGDTVYVGSEDGYLYSNNANTGSNNWKFKSGDRIKSTPAIDSTKIYVGSDDGYVYALNLSLIHI